MHRRAVPPPRRVHVILTLAAAVVTAAISFAAATDAAPAPAGGADRHSTPAPISPDRSSAPRPARLNGPVRWGVAERLCAAPKRGRAGCFAIRWKPATRQTPRAVPYSAADVGAGPGGGYAPAELAKAYGYDPAGSRGATQTVAIVDAYNDPYARAELNAFDAHYGLARETATSFRQLNQRGAASPLPATNAGWAGEIALDIEAVRAACRRCKIVLLEASSARSANLAAAVNTAARLGATEISNSYGGAEFPGEAATVVAAYNHPRTVITASTGDSGWYSWDLANRGNDASDNVPNTPAAYSTVVAVGGTRLELNPDGTRSAETVWNDDGPADVNGLGDTGTWLGDMGASGGGCSTIYPARSWQSGVTGYAQTGCGSRRLAGDIAADAAPGTGFSVYSHYNPGWGVFGGTSLSAPLVAGMWALAGGSGGVTYPAQSLYDHLRYTGSSLFDVATGGNAFCDGLDTTACSARVRTLTGDVTGNPNNLLNGNPFYPGGWAGLLDCGYDFFNGTEDTIAANTQCEAGAGYDGPSGVGTPNGLTAFTRMGPRIAMTAPALLRVGITAGFGATSFADNIPGATPASYRWTWGDGATTTTAGTSATHRYAVRGTYTPKLTVFDTAARNYTVGKRFTLGYAPTASISGYRTVRHRSTHTWTAHSVERNTGGRITGRVWRIGSRVWSRSTRLTHVFRRAGRYRITLTVTDNSRLRTSRAITVKVV